MIIVLGWIIHTIGGGAIWSLNEHKNFHFENDEDVHRNFKNYGENAYGLNLDTPTINLY
jgi:hypothetical protein